MKVSVIGTGYVGLVSGTCFAEIGHDVTCIDIDENKIKTLKEGKSPIYEPGLTDLLTRNIKSKRLHFSTDYDSVKEAQAIFLAVGTPSSDDGQADLKYLYSAAESVAKNLSDGAIVVVKSTVPVGTGGKVKELISKFTNKKFHVVNNPEFLKEGSAVEDFMRPDRVVIGYQEEEAARAMEELYAPLVRQGNPIYMMSNLSAEMTKYAANCFLATKISFINEIARLCDLVGADINEVRKGISSDQRIGKHFFYPGPGYGGSCFPKDVKALMFTAKEYGMDLSIVGATEDVNDSQKMYIYEKMKKHFGELKGRTFAFWGVAFKANTDDVRESSAIYMAKALVDAGAKVNFFDPVAGENYLKVMGDKYRESISMYDNKYDCLNECDAMVTMTEWREFSFPDFPEIKNRLKTPVIFDGRNLYETNKVLDHGFEYYAIGKRIK
ncbi:MAG: UDP-glucose/GDP-mannose dehydrogenase family protein [Deltaproteobacteria bacterium]|nr:MAG: UDP-glucose/GDP-mannose dehydrogenase family protein [Deltaproteobacteria bacterium]TNF28082.1 MAG: UDP-glucose/GDP-mannose dehydrogenase family protein [Deltaproteobacteria bacterium]